MYVNAGCTVIKDVSGLRDWCQYHHLPFCLTDCHERFASCLAPSIEVIPGSLLRSRVLWLLAQYYPPPSTPLHRCRFSCNTFSGVFIRARSSMSLVFLVSFFGRVAIVLYIYPQFLLVRMQGNKSVVGPHFIVRSCVRISNASAISAHLQLFFLSIGQRRNHK